MKTEQQATSQDITIQEPRKEEKDNYCLNTNSLIPINKECERFIRFLAERFNHELPQDFIVVINKTSKKAIGTYSPSQFENGKGDLKTITLSTYFLKQENPYETLTHELAHFITDIKGTIGKATNNYHNKHFKEECEKMLLNVEKGKYGFNVTSPTEEFNLMLEEFKPNKEVFNICEKIPTSKKGTRLFLWTCNCGFKVRCGNRDLKATCNLCDSEFKEVRK